MTAEDRLRTAITARTATVEPSTDALHRIEEKLMDTRRDRNRNRLLLGIAAAVAVIAALVGALVLTDDDEGTVDTAATSTTDAPSTTESTTTEPTTTTTVLGSTVDPATPVFPDPSTSRRFEDPVALTYAFAVDLLGFRDPIVGELAQGDARSGEVEVRAFATGQPTTVFVRQLEDDTWFVLGSSVDSIRLDSPAAGATIGSPLPLEGAASAFEGHVNVRLYADGQLEPVAETFVTGRGDGVLGDFTGELDFAVPGGARHGVLVLSEASAEDGSTTAATVVRVHF
jgi:hypothetical protein